MCPALDAKQCLDAAGITYGVLCDTRFSGIVITNSGKKERMVKKMMEREMEEEMVVEKRDITGTFNNCADFCNAYNDEDATPCMGVAFDGGYCMAYDTITGTFGMEGEIAALRQ
jgi:hypothetical protein